MPLLLPTSLSTSALSVLLLMATSPAPKLSGHGSPARGSVQQQVEAGGAGAPAPPAGREASGGGSEEGSPVAPDVGGSWAILQVTSAITEVPLMGDVVSDTISIGRLDIEQKGLKLSLQEKVCDLRLRSEASKVRTAIPQAFIRAIPVLRTRARLVEPEEPSGAFGFERGPSWMVLGAKLTRPTDEALPTEEEDPRVYDQDRDGHPGVTVEVEGLISGKIYLVQRGWNKLRGTHDPERHRIQGRIQWSSEQTILDSTSLFLASQPTTRVNPDGARNHFIAKRLSKRASCGAILKSTQKLFAP